MATGALGSVSNRLRHENGDTHVVICDDVFSDAGSTPAASTIRLGRAADEENGALSEPHSSGRVEGHWAASLMVFDPFPFVEQPSNHRHHATTMASSSSCTIST